MEAEEVKQTIYFHEMGLDDRILKAVAQLGWAEPTLIQEKAIPLVLEGKDILARARTGSGKTGSYAIPLVQKILTAKHTAREQSVRALVMTPTKELCNQAFRNIKEMSSCCSREVRCVDISGSLALNIQKPQLMELPDIVVGTPGRVLAHLTAGNLTLKSSLEMLVVDEADLAFSLGYEDDIRALLSYLPKMCQSILMSATLSEDIKTLKKLLLHNPVILKLEESQLPEASQLTQYHIKCEEEDKFVLIYTLVKLRLIRGKSIMFVNNIDRCYRLKLFFEQFGIPSCVLNSELPVNSRCHIVNQFNEGLYDIIVAADEAVLEDPGKVKSQAKKSKRHKRDKESGVARGIDFRHVSNVINFDFPLNTDAYIHRVGRTARGDNHGTALSFVNISEMTRLQEVEVTLSQTHSGEDSVFKPYQFKMEEIEGFRYRAKDAMRAVTKVAVREARLKEIKQQILASNKLKSYFEDNPRDLQILRHDKSLHTAKVHEHMKHVPDYLVPSMLRNTSGNRKRRYNGPAEHQHRPQSKGQEKYKKRQADPLKSFEFSGLKAAKRKKAPQK